MSVALDDEPTLSDVAKAQLAVDATRWERKMHALTMRNMGAVYPAIGAALGVSANTARVYVQDAIRELVIVPVDQMVERQRSILLDIVRQNYPIAMSTERPLDERHAAQSMIVRTLEHEAKLYGLNAPTRVNVGISETDFGLQAADIIKLVGTAPLREMAGLPPGFDSIATGDPEQETEDAEIVELPPEDDDWSNL